MRTYTQDEVNNMLDQQACRTANQLIKNTYTREQVEKFLLDVMNLGMVVRQDQLNGYSEKSGNEILQDWINNNLK